jgi:catechol 2,3-dioxygenase
MDTMVTFYSETFGLAVLRRFPPPGPTFLRIADDFGGHTAILGLFPSAAPSNYLGKAWTGHNRQVTTLHHWAMTIPLDEHDEWLTRLTGRGLEPTTATHAWVGWRSIYVLDPETNVVELVCYDEAALQTGQ